MVGRGRYIVTRSTTLDSDEEIGKIYSRNSFEPHKEGRKTGEGVDLSTRRSSSDKDRFSFVVSYRKDSHVGEHATISKLHLAYIREQANV